MLVSLIKILICLIIVSCSIFSQQNILWSGLGTFTDSVKTDILPRTKMAQNKQLPQRYSDIEKLMLFDINKKNPTTAVLLSLAFVGGGHIYTGHWDKAGGFLFSEVSTIGVTYYTFLNTENMSVLYVGYTIVLIVRLWEIIDASNEVTNYNENLFRKLTGKPITIGLNEKNNNVGVQFSYAF